MNQKSGQYLFAIGVESIFDKKILIFEVYKTVPQSEILLIEWNADISIESKDKWWTDIYIEYGQSCI